MSYSIHVCKCYTILKDEIQYNVEMDAFKVIQYNSYYSIVKKNSETNGKEG